LALALMPGVALALASSLVPVPDSSLPLSFWRPSAP
jgi:hypothetical protein